MTQVDSFSRILAETLHQGGVLLFIEEGMTAEAREFLQALKSEYSGQIPFLEKPLKAVTEGHYHPQMKDLLFVGELPLEERQALAIVCRAQIASQQATFESLQDTLWDVKANPLPSLIHVLKDFLEKEFPQQAGATEAPARALFLDRDDVIVKNVPYNKDPAKVELMPGIVELIGKAHQKGMLVIVCSNQSGLGRGLVTQPEYFSVHQRFLQLLAENKGWIEDCLWAGYIENPIGDQHLQPQMRKPRPGMFLQAAQKWHIHMAASAMIGDSATDLIAAFTAGVSNLILLKSEKFEQEKERLLEYQKSFAHFRFSSAGTLDEVQLP